MKKTTLKEYENLHNEISHKIETTNSLSTFMITTVVTILTFAVTQDIPEIYILPLCIIIPISVRIAYYRETIAKISAYIITFFESDLKELNWETRNCEMMRANKIEIIKLCRFSEGFFLSIICFGLYLNSYIGKNSSVCLCEWQIVISFLFVLIEGMIVIKINSVDQERLKWCKKWEGIKKTKRKSIANCK